MSFTHRVSKWSLATLLACLSAVALPSLAADPAPSAPVAGTWVLHKDQFDYYGLTSLFSCSSLEDHVKDILVHFGARKDAHVYANGCPRGTLTPSHFASVRAEFYTLQPAEDPAATGVVNAQWTALEMSPRHPFFINDGDCELVQDMKDILQKNFALRDVNYRTGCVPHELSLNGFSVTAQALKAVPQPKVSALTR
jgi:hypothetical protein